VARRGCPADFAREPAREAKLRLVRLVWMERLLTVEFGPSRSKRFGRAVAEAQSGAGECSEVEPGRYRTRFVLGEEAAAYTGLARVLERVRHWRATEVYEDEEPVSVFHAKDIRVSVCPTSPIRLTAAGCEIAAVGCSAAFRRVRRRPALVSLLWALPSLWVGGSGRG
jgi:hypothetical protein